MPSTRSIRSRFGAPSSARCAASSTAWADAAPASALAQILLLDQFTRNAFRGTARAFAGDARALAAASRMVGAREDEALPAFMRGFVYLPFEHAESLAMQDEAVRLFTRLAAEAPEQASMLDYAHRHRAVIERFGRFPHRNEILGRALDRRGARVPAAAGLEVLSRGRRRRFRADAGCRDDGRPRSARRRRRDRRATRRRG